MKEILIVHYTLQKEDIRKTTNKNGNEQFYYLYEEKKKEKKSHHCEKHALLINKKQIFIIIGKIFSALYRDTITVLSTLTVLD